MVTFNVSADAYTRFMGRYSEPLALRFAALTDVRAGSGRWTWGVDREH